MVSYLSCYIYSGKLKLWLSCLSPAMDTATPVCKAQHPKSTHLLQLKFGFVSLTVPAYSGMSARTVELVGLQAGVLG